MTCVDVRSTAYRAWRSLGYAPTQCLAAVYGQPSLYLLGSEWVRGLALLARGAGVTTVVKKVGACNE